MISLKRYLDQSIHRTGSLVTEDCLAEIVLKAYCASLTQMGECGVDACPDLAPEFARSLKRIVESLGSLPARDSVIASEDAVRELLRGWGRQVSGHYDRKATDEEICCSLWRELRSRLEIKMTGWRGRSTA